MMYLPRLDQHRVAPAALTSGVHALLAMSLFLGVRWQIQSPNPVSVELWSPQEISTPVPAEAPAVIPEAVAPPPVPKVAPPPPTPESVRPPSASAARTAQAPPDIAIEHAREERKRREEQARLEADKEARKREDKQREERAQEQKRKEAKAREEKEREQRVREEQVRLDKLAQQELKDTQRRTIEQQLNAETAAVKADIARREAAARDAASSSAALAAARATWRDRISGKIRGNVVLPDNLTGNPEVAFDVLQLPTGEVMSAKLRRSSGVKAYDDAVERAIWKSSPLPRPERAELFERELHLVFKPKED